MGCSSARSNCARGPARPARDVYVAKGYGGGPIEYQWREVGVEGVYTTDTNCQQI